MSSYSTIMVKRRCPFADDLNPQLKIHVRDKEVFNGVLSSHHMKQVFDRTKDLLYQGAKKLTSTMPSQESNSVVSRSLLPNGSCTFDSMKQLQLTPHGQINVRSNVEVIPASFSPCSKCSSLNQTEMSCCSFCDKSLCQKCTSICIKCHDLVCSACSFNVYDASEGHICRNCL